MNVFAADPTAMRAVASRTVADRVADAERRAAVRALRAERREARRAARASSEDSVRRLPLWTFRFVRAVH